MIEIERNRLCIDIKELNSFVHYEQTIYGHVN